MADWKVLDRAESEVEDAQWVSPDVVVPPSVQSDILDEMLASQAATAESALQAASSATSALESENSAKSSEAAAASSASSALASKQSAYESEVEAGNSEAMALTHKQGSQNAHTAAEAAQTAAESARVAAEAAQAGAEAARDLSEDYRDAASGYAQTAQSAKATAVEKATEAATSASNASGYSLSALQSKSAAEAAEIASESARDSAVSAKTASESAKDLSLSHKNDAQISMEAAEAAKVAAQAAEQAAEDARDLAEGYKNTASGHASTASEQSVISTTKAEEAALSASAAITAKTESEAARDKAGEWADKPEDVEVEPGKFSAKHWAAKAQGFSSTSAYNISYDNAMSGMISINVQDAIDELAESIVGAYGAIENHTINMDNPHGVTKAQVGLGDVDNTPDVNKSVYYAETAGGVVWTNVSNKPSTLSGYGITDAASSTHNHAGAYQPADADLTAIGELAGTSGLLKKTGTNTWTLDTASYLTGITSGQVTSALGFTPAAQKGDATTYGGAKFSLSGTTLTITTT